MGEDVFSLLTETGGNRQILILKHFRELPEEPSLWAHYFILECYYLFLLLTYYVHWLTLVSCFFSRCTFGHTVSFKELTFFFFLI